MYPVYFSNVGVVGPDEAFMLSYKVALAANFITGIISAVLGGVGPQILKFVPPAGLLVPIAGIGIAFLGLEQLTASIKAPLVGYSTIIWVCKYIGVAQRRTCFSRLIDSTIPVRSHTGIIALFEQTWVGTRESVSALETIASPKPSWSFWWA